MKVQSMMKLITVLMLLAYCSADDDFKSCWNEKCQIEEKKVMDYMFSSLQKKVTIKNPKKIANSDCDITGTHDCHLFLRSFSHKSVQQLENLAKFKFRHFSDFVYVHENFNLSKKSQEDLKKLFYDKKCATEKTIENFVKFTPKSLIMQINTGELSSFAEKIISSELDKDISHNQLKEIMDIYHELIKKDFEELKKQKQQSKSRICDNQKLEPYTKIATTILTPLSNLPKKLKEINHNEASELIEKYKEIIVKSSQLLNLYPKFPTINIETQNREFCHEIILKTKFEPSHSHEVQNPKEQLENNCSAIPSTLHKDIKGKEQPKSHLELGKVIFFR